MPGNRRPSSLDAQIQAARDRGDFDELPGRGKPLGGDEFDNLPPEERFEARLMRTLGEALPEVTLVREIREIRSRLAGELAPNEREALDAALRSKVAHLAAMLKSRRSGEER